MQAILIGKKRPLFEWAKRGLTMLLFGKVILDLLLNQLCE